jgi:hypothetical protein
VLSSPSVNIGAASTLLAWDGAPASKPRLLATVPPRDGWNDAAVLPGDKLLLADPVGVAVYNPRDHRLGPEVNGYELSFVLSPSRQLAALIYLSGKVDVWDMKGQDVPLPAYQVANTVQSSYAFTTWDRSGTILGIADPTAGVELIPALEYVPFRQLLPVARSLAVTKLTKAEDKQFVP